MTQTMLPHWDMTVVYPGFESGEFEAGFLSSVRAIDDLTALFDQHGIMQRDVTPLNEATVLAADSAIAGYNAVLREVHTLWAYIRSFVSTDSRDERAQARLSELQQHIMRLSLLSTRLTAWIGSLDVEGLIERSAVARDHAFSLRKAKARAAHLMPPALE